METPFSNATIRRGLNYAKLFSREELPSSGYDIADIGRTHTLLRPPGTTSPVGHAGGIFSDLVPRIEASSYGL